MISQEVAAGRAESGYGLRLWWLTDLNVLLADGKGAFDEVCLLRIPE